MPNNNNWVVRIEDKMKPDHGQQSSTSTILQEVKVQPGNPDLADMANGNFKIPTQPTMTSLQGDDRVPRIDLLWKGRDDEMPPEESLASASNSHFEFIKFKKESKIFPHFNKMDREDNLPSRTASENNNNNTQIVEKKSDEEEGRNREKLDHHGSIRRSNKPLDRREAFNWPWHSGNYQVTFHFRNPEFRTEFSSKMLLLKTLQWLIIFCWTVGAKNISCFKNNSTALMWSLYIAVLLHIITFLSARSTNWVETTCSSCFVMITYTICLAHSAAILYIFYDNPLIPSTVLTLLMAYLIVVSYCTCLKMDVQESKVYFPMSIFIFIFSIAAFWIVMMIRDESAKQTSRYIGTVWCPSLIIAQIVASVEMSEIHSLLAGNRAPLGPQDWSVGATFLL